MFKVSDSDGDCLATADLPGIPRIRPCLADI